MDNDLKEEWYREMLEEARADEIEEYKLRSDYDYFIDKYQYEIETFRVIYKELEKLHTEYCWEFDIGDLL